MTESHNYGLLANKLIEVIREGTGCQLIEGGTAGPQPDKPFFSYEVISPYIPMTIDVADNEVFESVVSIKCHIDSSIQTLNLLERLRKHLNGFSVRVDFQNSKIALVPTTQFQKRDNFISIDYGRLAGLDARFRVQDSYVDNVVIIENIDIQEENK